MTDSSGFRLVDVFGAVDLGKGYLLATVVDTDGHTWPVLYDTRQRATQFIPYLDEHFRELAPHELLGRLPERFEQFRCGAQAASGRPCRSRVGGPGQRCRHHVEATAPPPSTDQVAPNDPGTLFGVDQPRDHPGRES